MKRLYIITFLIVFIFNKGLGTAAECRSELGAHFKPALPGWPLSWAVETIVVTGAMENPVLERTFNNQFLFVGMDLNFASHQIYLEGGYKNWHRSDEGPGLGGKNPGWSQYPLPEKRHYGMREAYYRFQGDRTTFKVGLLSVKLNGSMLLDERTMGAHLTKVLGAFDIDMSVGTVMTGFARMGDFCGTRHVYRLLRGGRFTQVGNDLGETNFVGGVLTWNPNYEKPAETNVEEADSFGDDEFVFDSDFSESSRSRPLARMGCTIQRPSFQGP